MGVPCINDDLTLKSEGDIPEIFFEYLALQCGDISHLLANKVEWEVAYNDRLYKQYQAMLPYLPTSADRIMDVGSGLGGIDVLLNRHYDGGVFVTLVDGEDDPPSHLAADITFSHADVAKEFLKANGVKHVNYIPAKRASLVDKPWPQDLIMSSFAYCFHLPPDMYLDFIHKSLSEDKETTLIFDVRKGKPEWSQTLENVFGKGVPIMEKDKYIKTVYHASK